MKRLLTLPLLLLSLAACGDDGHHPRPDLGSFDGGPDAGTDCPDETPDDTPQTAQDLPDIDSSADFPVGEIFGTIDPIDDIDWFVFHDEDVAGGDMEPRVALAARTSDQPWELCQYFVCDGGTTTFTCPEGTTDAMEGDLRGCCMTTTDGGAAMDIEPTCEGDSSDDGDVYASVRRLGGEVTCLGYVFSYGDD
tara:strand:+ start:630 stop:1208 length:579 start_codon:yes stop_codon:yes gene_type:complete